MNDHPIPNRLVLAVAALSVPWAYFHGVTWAGYGANAVMALAILAAWLLRLLPVGGGVVKLTAAFALWLGPTQQFFAFLAIAFGAMSLAWGVMRLRGGAAQSMPYLPFAAIGFVVVLASPNVSPWLAQQEAVEDAKPGWTLRNSL